SRKAKVGKRHTAVAVHLGKGRQAVQHPGDAVLRRAVLIRSRKRNLVFYVGPAGRRFGSAEKHPGVLFYERYACRQLPGTSPSLETRQRDDECEIQGLPPGHRGTGEAEPRSLAM